MGKLAFRETPVTLQGQSLYPRVYPQDSGVWGVGVAAPTHPCAHLPLLLQMLSMLPTRILRLLEFVGFSGNKVTNHLLSEAPDLLSLRL